MATAVKHKTSALQFIRTIYLSLAALIGLSVFVFGAVSGINLFLSNVVFPVDTTSNYYYSPYQKDGCEQETVYVDGQTQFIDKTEAEVAECRDKMAESQEIAAQNEFNRSIAMAIAMVLVGLPVWILHFLFMQADWKRTHEE
ncbi:MAG: hypothetical protein ACRCZE_02765 [Candidatus Altimarinota bacterium]